jgi:putative solute:sodium symporter small subunit
MEDGRRSNAARAYWRANKILIAVLLAVWALVSHVFAIFLARPLSAVDVGGVPMSFWWAQQGSMVVFVVLIFVYAVVMDRLDERYDVHEERPLRSPGRGPGRGEDRGAGSGPHATGTPAGGPGDGPEGSRGGDR